ncbi:MAG: Ldh family oxidoreductase [Syntrophomonadaceae bacterium]|nr:Ldh family oxidoreductase [Syntrophomonadaceae bacterium]
MSSEFISIPFNLMEEFMIDVFMGLGVPEEDARICADVLITADKRGIDSHGIGRLKPIYYDRIKAGIQSPVTVIDIIREGPTTAVVDGNNGMGQVIAYRCMQMAIERAQKYGMGMVAARNSTHYGIAGYYTLMAIEKDMIGITGTNARPSIAPTFGVENMLGTNPLTIGIPSDEDFPFVIDCATSVSQRGKIEVYERLNEDIPPGWVIDENGMTRTDTAQILKDLVTGSAALTPLGGIGEEQGGHKGFGYATAVEILSAALQGGAFLKALTGFDGNGNKQPYRLGHFFMAIDINAFIEVEQFKATSGEILRQIRNSRKAPGHDRIFTAGEKEYDAWLERRHTGVPVNAPLQNDMRIMREELGLNKYRFPFD